MSAERMRILGLSAYYHDAAAALVGEGRIVAAAQEERFSRRKHDPAFPAGAARWCLEYAGLAARDLDAVVFYEKPLLRLERILETAYAAAPRGLFAFVAGMPSWLKEKLLLRSTLRRELEALGPGGGRCPVYFAEHHLSHAASAFYPSPFDEAAVLTIDGVGEWATATIGHGRGGGLTVLREQRFPHSLGLFYSAVTAYLGFRVNSGEYKVMGLAPYGEAARPQAAALGRILRERFVDVKDDGSIWLAPDLFDFFSRGAMIRARRWARLLGVPPRRPEAPISEAHRALALAAQRLAEEVVLRMAREARRLTGARRLCMAGGVALNCVANRRLLDAGLFDDLWIQPAAGDAGGALGAALAAHHLRFSAPRAPSGSADALGGALLGAAIDDADVLRLARARGAPFERHETMEGLSTAVAELLAAGKVVGWCQGRAEWGPRALGNRSILADPRRRDMRERLNRAVKRRETFRPFAPAVLAEDASALFDLDRPSPYMLLVAPVRDATLPAVTHVDGSARVQTVHRDTNPEFASLLEAFKARTGCAALVNTSFNVRGEPIVNDPGDAYRCFMTTEIDALAMGRCLFLKERQPALPNAEASRGPPSLD